jgi:hypothetical protein
MTIGNVVPTTDNGEDTVVRDGSKNLRDIEDLVAKLQIVTKQLALPPRSMPVQRSALTSALASSAVTSSAVTSSADEFAHAQSLGPGEAGDPNAEWNQ